MSRRRHPLGRDDPLASHYPSAGAPPVLAGLRKLPRECSSRDETDGVGVQVEPEVVLPAQVFDRRADLLQPEKRLMLAILEDATATLLRHPTPRHAGKRRALRETEAWLDSPDTESPFAFIRICEALGLDAQWLRAGLARAQVAREGERATYRRRLVRRMAGTRHRISGHRFG